MTTTTPTAGTKPKICKSARKESAASGTLGLNGTGTGVRVGLVNKESCRVGSGTGVKDGS